MATVTGITAERMAELVAAYIVDATVNSMGNLILTTAGGTEIDAGPIILNGTAAQYYRGDKTWQTLNKSAVGLSNVDNVSVVADYVPKWKANTAYLANDLVLSPYGQLLRADSVMLSPASFSTTGWTNLTPGPAEVRTNLATNPAMKGVGASAVMRTNLVTNPSSNGTSTTGWTPARATIAAQAAAITGLTQQYFRVTLTDVVAGSYFQRVDMSALPVTAGLSYSLSLWMRTVAGPRQAGAQLIFLNASSVQVGTSIDLGAVNGATWTKLSNTAVAPATATQAIVRIGVSNQASWAISDFFDFGAVLLEANAIVGTYFDGATAAAGDFTHAWAGTAYASASQQKALPPTLTAIMPGTNGVAYIYKTTTDAPPGHTDSAKAVWTQPSSGGSPGITYTPQQGGVTGDILTAKLWVKFDVQRTVKLLVRARLVSTNVSVDPTDLVTIPANTWVELTASTTATGTYDNVQVWPLLVSPGHTSVAGSVAFLGKVLIEKAAFVGNYFDGSSVVANDVVHGWTGTANASTSTATPSISVRKWRPGIGYVVGQQVINPYNEIVKAKTTRTSGSAWTATESANWTSQDNVMTFKNSGFGWSGDNAIWDVGPLSLSTTSESESQRSAASFATAGSLSGTIKFLEPGIYDVVFGVNPNGNPGNRQYSVQTSGTWPGPIDSLWGKFGMVYVPDNILIWETTCTAVGIRIPTANLEVRLAGQQSLATSNITVVKIIKRGSI